MINNEKEVSKLTAIYQERILKRADISELLNKRKSLAKRKEQLRENLSVYADKKIKLTAEREELTRNITRTVSEGGDPSQITQRRREVDFSISDLVEFSESVEAALNDLTQDEAAITTQLDVLLQRAAGNEMIYVSAEVNEDLRIIEDKTEAWRMATATISSKFGTGNNYMRLSLENRELRNLI